MFISAPTPLPFAFSDANSGGRSSSFSNSIVIVRPPEPERDLDLRRPVPVVLDLEALDARHQLRHLRRVVEHAPRPSARGASNSFAPTTFTRRHLDVRPRRLRIAEHLPDPVVRIAAVVHDRRRRRGAMRPGSPRRRVDAAAAALAHPLRAERRERRRRLDAPGLERRHVERVRHVVVVEVGRQQRSRPRRRRRSRAIAAPIACAVAPCTWPSTICGWMRVPQSSTAA